MTRRVVGRKRPEASTGIGLWWIIGLLVLVALSTFALPVVLLLTIGMLPSWVAFIVDTRPGKAAGKCVMPLNMAGIAPYLASLLAVAGQGETDTAFLLLTDPTSWLVMYGTAGIGWLIYFGMPYLVSAVIETRAEHRKARLVALRKELIEGWGEEIAHVPPQLNK